MIKVKYNILNNCIESNTYEIIDTILETRGVKNTEDFLNPNECHLIEYTKLYNIDKAKDIILNGIHNNKSFIVLLDTDCDGIMSGTIMYRYLQHFTNNIKWTINSGKQHGLATQDLDRFTGNDILIIVDSLDGDIKKYQEIYKMGIQTIILDHHDIQIPIDSEYYTLVSSNYRYDNQHLSGAGVVWKFCKYIDTILNTSYADDYSDLATCGLIADMSDLSENSMENRYICSLGFNNLNNQAIKKIVGSFEFNSTSVSYSIAPLINASMRVSKNEVAAKLFLTDNPKEISGYIKELKSYKERQNDEIDSIRKDLIDQAETQLDKKVIYIIIDTESDVAGLIGNKLLELYQRPLFILRKKIKKEDDNEIAYYGGSGRAIGLDNFRSLCASTELCKAMGHESAFGVEILEEDFEIFKGILEDELKYVEFEITKNIDVELSLENIDKILIDNFKKINKISGTGFKPIVVKVSGVADYEIGNMSQGKHLVIKTSSLQFIKWNWQGSFADMEDNALLSEPLEFIGGLDSGFIGRTFMLKMIIDEMKVG